MKCVRTSKYSEKTTFHFCSLTIWVHSVVHIQQATIVLDINNVKEPSFDTLHAIATHSLLVQLKIYTLYMCVDTLTCYYVYAYCVCVCVFLSVYVSLCLCLYRFSVGWIQNDCAVHNLLLRLQAERLFWGVYFSMYMYVYVRVNVSVSVWMRVNTRQFFMVLKYCTASLYSVASLLIWIRHMAMNESTRNAAVKWREWWTLTECNSLSMGVAT